MSAIEKLRKLLDERGVEHYDGTELTLWLKDGLGYRASADEGLNGFIHLHLWCTTPEQAVEATLGRGECHDCLGDIEPFECSECHRRSESKFPNYCYYCGRKVVS